MYTKLNFLKNVVPIGIAPIVTGQHSVHTLPMAVGGAKDTKIFGIPEPREPRSPRRGDTVK